MDVTPLLTRGLLHYKAILFEAVKIHHLVPRRDEIFDEFLLRIITSINLGIRSKLGVRTEDKIDTRAGPFQFARAAVAAFKKLFSIIDRVPRRREIEQVREEIV